MPILSVPMGLGYRCVLLCACLLLAPFGWAQQPRFERLVTDDTPQPPNFIGAVNAVAQDDIGFMWFGGDNGVVRYDGHQFKLYPEDHANPRALLGHYVHAMAVDKVGVLWVATGQGLSRYTPASDDFDHWCKTCANRLLAGSDVSALTLDMDNNLWLATEAGLSVLDAKRETLSHYPLPQSDTIRAMHLSASGQLWLGLNGGVQIFNITRRQWLPAIPAQPALANANIRAIAADYLGHLWVASFDQGIFELSPTGELLHHHLHDPLDPTSLPENSVWSLWVDRQFDIWVATNRHGLARRERGGKGFVRYQHHVAVTSSVDSDQVRALYEDKLGDMWIGTAPGGINFYNRASDIFSHYQAGLEANTLSDNSVISLARDPDGKLWVGTEKGLNLFDPQTELFQRIVHDSRDPQSLCQNSVLTLQEDGPTGLWVGTWGGGLCRLDKTTGKFKRYSYTRSGPGSLPSAYIWQLFRDREGHLWVATEDQGLQLYRPESDDFEAFRSEPENPNSPSSNFVLPLLQDKNGDLWFGTLKGLNRMKKNSRRISRLEKELPEVTGQRILALIEDDLGRIWIGTEAAGIVVFNPADGSRKVLGAAQGLPSKRITSFVSDRDQNIWAGGMDGLVKIEPHNFWVSTLKKQQGLLGNNFIRNASLCLPDGPCYFGSSQGLTRFNPADLARERQPPKVVFTDVRVGQVPVWNRPSAQMPSGVKWQGNQLTLDYDHTSIEFDFAALSFRGSAYNAYSYRLHGFDRGWVEVGTKNSASYTRLAPGDYVFEVRGANNEGDWNLIGPTIPLHVEPPPWMSWPALVLYMLTVAALVGAGILLVRRQERMRKTADQWLEAYEQERLKGQYYVQAAAALGDPLLNITGLAQGLGDGIYGPVATAMAEPIEAIGLNASRLASQVNNIVDFAQMAAKTLVLRPKPVVLNRLVDEVFVLLKPLTAQKSVNLINGLREDIEVVADVHCLRQILFNLVSNAIKYTSEGYVMVMASRQSGAANGYATVVVEDTGIGIAEHRQHIIFKAFTNLQNEDKRVTGGIGLSLAVTQAMVKLLGGHLQVDSKLDVGSRFTFSLLLAQTLEGQLPVKRAGATVVVDDDALGRLLLVTHFHKMGITPVEIDSAAVARQQLLDAPGQIGLVVLNTQVKGLNCYELLHRLRQQGGGRQLPVVFISPTALAKPSGNSPQDPNLIQLVQPVTAEHIHQLCEQYLQMAVRPMRWTPPL